MDALAEFDAALAANKALVEEAHKTQETQADCELPARMLSYASDVCPARTNKYMSQTVQIQFGGPGQTAK
jgi:hypothetical protein